MPPRRRYSLPPPSVRRSSPDAAPSPSFPPLSPSPDATLSTPPERLAAQIEKADDEGDDVVRRKKIVAAGKAPMEQEKAVEQPPGQQFPQQDDAPEGENDGDCDRYSDSEYEIEEKIPKSAISITCCRGAIESEFKCIICFGILRKTRTVKKCLHRFCRECIDKSIRTGNMECPACRIHFASRRDLADDPVHDSIIAAVYPDIERYEKEALALNEEEKSLNDRTQATIAETIVRQLAARRKKGRVTGATYSRRSRGGSRSATHGTTVSASDDHGIHMSNAKGGRHTSTPNAPSSDITQQRSNRGVLSRFSPLRAAKTVDVGHQETDNLETNRENTLLSPLQAGIGEMLAWGKNAARSQTRHGHATANASTYAGGNSSANARGNASANAGGNYSVNASARISKLIDHLRLEKKHEEEPLFQSNVHLNLVSLDKEIPNLERPYFNCRPTVLIGQLCIFIANQMQIQDEEVQLYAKKPQYRTSAAESVRMPHCDPQLGRLERLEKHESLDTLIDSFMNDNGELVLLYSLKHE